MNLKNLKKYNFELDDYSKFNNENRKVYLFDNTNCDELLEKFYTKILSSIETKKHLPIIRIADGEYQFLLGKNEFNLRKPIYKLGIHILRQFFEKIFNLQFEAKSRTYTSGVYSKDDMTSVKNKYADCLHHISKNGIIALYTVIKPYFYTEQYLPKLFKFFKFKEIELTSSNYMPFYFIYILLTNKKYADLYKDKNIHLITSFNSVRKEKIEHSLNLLKPKSISWTKISRDKSLFDKVNIDSISDEIDIIFIGAGVGKVNIFNQLKNKKCLIIDAGYIFETWENPQLVNERDYCRITN
jgi:hypothetical protein